MRATAFTTLGNFRLQESADQRLQPTLTTLFDAISHHDRHHATPTAGDLQLALTAALRNPAGQHAQRGGDRAAAAGRCTASPVPARFMRDTSLVPAAC